MVEPYDGTDYGKAVRTQTAQIFNTPPVITGVTVTTLGVPNRAAIITALPQGYYDMDGDPPGTHNYIWFKNGIPIPDAPHTISLRNTADHTYFTKGDVITVQVIPYDGTDYGTPVNSSNSITIINTPPVLKKATLSYTEPVNRTSVLTVYPSGFSDPDGDLTSNYYYNWFVNGNLVLTRFNENTISGIFVNRDRVYCRVTPNDGEDNGTPVSTKSVLIQDSPPEVYGVAILKADHYPVNEHSVLYVDTYGLKGVDIDGERVNFVFVWFVNGKETGAPEENSLSSIYFNKGDSIFCRVFAYDSILRSRSYVDTSPLTAGNTPPVALITRPYNNSFHDVEEEVKLDASGSYDPDSANTLSYFWYVDTEKVAEGMNANIFLPPGDHTIRLEVSDGTSNDTTEVKVHIRAPDLLITPDRIIVSGALYGGETQTFVVNVGNIGDGDAKNVSINFYMDGILIAVREIDYLESRNNDTTSISWNGIIGTHTLKVVVDPNNILKETNKENNVATRKFEITKQPEKKQPFLGIQDIYWYVIIGMLALTIFFGVGDLKWRNKSLGEPKKAMDKSEKP